MESPPLPNIFDYADYRTYLKDYYAGRKRGRPTWSFAVWARQLGIKSPSTLAMVLNGHRRPGTDLVRRLTRQMQLSREEATYFSNLVLLKKSGDDLQQRLRIMESLGRQRSTGKFTYLDHETFSAIASWHCYAIRELVCLPGFREDPEWICRSLRFPITVAEVRASIQILLRVGLLTRKADGTLAPARGHTETSSDAVDTAIRSFHEQAFDNAKRSLHHIAVDEREITGTTFAMSRSQMDQAKELIRKFRDELCDLLESPGADAVYHIQLALYPVAKVEAN